MTEEEPQQRPAGLRGLRVRGDEGKLRQALINLLGNAVKFAEQGGVTLRVAAVVKLPEDGRRRTEDGGPTTEDRCRVPGAALRPPSSVFRFEVVDTGPGIPPELQARLFQPFQQGESAAGKGGTGLGLAITRRLMETMGGQVGVESRLGEGSRFWIEVPLEAAEQDRAPEVAVSGGLASDHAPARLRRLASGVTVRALVVDDVQENRDILSAMLRQMGCQVEVAAGGLEAIECAKRQAPDIVFLDIRMPGMDGMETLARLKTGSGQPRSTDLAGSAEPRPAGMRFVAVSASVLGRERDCCLTAGFDAFLGKPFLVSELVALLDRVLDVTWAATESAVAEPGALTVPPELLGRLKSCARGYRVTELKQGLTELEQLGPAGAALATRLRRLAQFSSMTEAIALIEEVETQPNPEAAP